MSRFQSTIVISRDGTAAGSRRDFEDALAAALRASGNEALVIPPLYYLRPSHPAARHLSGKTEGDLLVASWLPPRAAFWTLRALGESAARSEAEVRTPEVRGERTVCCLDLAGFASVEACAAALKDAAAPPGRVPPPRKNARANRRPGPAGLELAAERRCRRGGNRRTGGGALVSGDRLFALHKLPKVRGLLFVRGLFGARRPGGRHQPGQLQERVSGVRPDVSAGRDPVPALLRRRRQSPERRRRRRARLKDRTATRAPFRFRGARDRTRWTA